MPTKPFDVRKYLTTPEAQLAYLKACLAEGHEAFAKGVFEVVDMLALHERGPMTDEVRNRKDGRLMVRVVVEGPPNAENDPQVIADYLMDHNDPIQRRVLGEQCRNCYEASQSIWTCPEE